MYCSMLLNLREGRFFPDATRAAWMGLGGANLGVPSTNLDAGSDTDNAGNRIGCDESEPNHVVPQKDAQSSDDEVISASSGESSGDSADSDVESSISFMRQEDQVQMPRPRDQDIPGPCWINKRSKTVHKIVISEYVTSCGRRVNLESFSFLEHGTSSLNPRCTLCYKGELITSREQMAQRLGWSIVAEKPRLDT